MVGDEFKDFSGLYFRSLLVVIVMLVFMLFFGGILLMVGFMGKFWIFSVVID